MSETNYAGYERILQETSRVLSQDNEDAQRILANPEAELKNRSEEIYRALQNAKMFYKRREYPRAFAEWDKVCSYLGENDPFRDLVMQLRHSHENFIRANEEFSEIKQAMAQRLSPSPAEKKVIEEAHEEMNAQVKNIYSSIGKELRTERVPKTLSFWWPVAASIVLVAVGSMVLWSYHARMRSEGIAVAAPAVTAPVIQGIDPSALAEQKEAFQKQIQAMKLMHEEEIATLNRKHAESARGDREKVIQLETSLREEQSRTAELERRASALLEGNLNKDQAANNLQ